MASVSACGISITACVLLIASHCTDSVFDMTHVSERLRPPRALPPQSGWNSMSRAQELGRGLGAAGVTGRVAIISASTCDPNQNGRGCGEDCWQQGSDEVRIPTGWKVCKISDAMTRKHIHGRWGIKDRRSMSNTRRPKEQICSGCRK
jgi:hypothetical protein